MLKSINIMKKIYLLSFLFLSGLLTAQPVVNKVDAELSTIPVYSKFEIDVDLTAEYTNAYDYSQINLKAVFTSPTGEVITVDGFFFQDYSITDQTTGNIRINGNPIWKIRFSPTEVGEWEFAVSCIDKNGTSNSVQQNFTCIESNSKGFIRKANNKFMKFDDGSLFFAVGENMCWSSAQNKNNIIRDYKKWIDDLTLYNGNFIRLWMAQWSFGVEWSDTPLKDYTNRQDNAFYLDWVVDYAETKDVFIELCLNYHGQFSTQHDSKWAENPYNIANGGSCRNPQDFFRNNSAKENYKNKLRYIVARWGYSTAIFSWEEFNEVDMVDNFQDFETEIIEWTDEMGKYMRNIDVNNHLISTSCAVAYNADTMWNLPILDYTQTHYYLEDDEIEITLVNGTQSFINKYNKPTINGEFGLSTLSENLLEKDPKGIHIHNALWSTAVSGSFGVGMSWWWDNYIHTIQAYTYFKEISEFMSGIDLVSTDYIPQSFNSVNYYTIMPSSAWGRALENDFTISPTESINNLLLSQFLYSKNSGSSSLANPPTFNIEYHNDGAFSVLTGGEIGVSPNLEIMLDGNSIFRSNVSINSTYTVDIPKGNHKIKIQIVGADWVKVFKYIFDDINSDDIVSVASSKIKSNGLVSSNSAFGWVHNRQYNWSFVDKNGEPESIEKSQIIVRDLEDANYRVSFFSTLTGGLVSQIICSSNSGELIVDVPDVLWDYSFSVKYESPILAVLVDNKKDDKIKIYPNPVHSVLTIVGCESNANITVYNVTGEVVLSSQLIENTLDMSMLEQGVHVLKIETKEKNYNYKIVK
jgi:hypothetical protein